MKHQEIKFEWVSVFDCYITQATTSKYIARLVTLFLKCQTFKLTLMIWLCGWENGNCQKRQAGVNIHAMLWKLFLFFQILDFKFSYSNFPNLVLQWWDSCLSGFRAWHVGHFAFDRLLHGHYFPALNFSIFSLMKIRRMQVYVPLKSRQTLFALSGPSLFVILKSSIQIDAGHFLR